MKVFYALDMKPSSTKRFKKIFYTKDIWWQSLDKW